MKRPIILTVLILLASVFSGMAQPASRRSDVTVYFRLDKYDIDPQYLDNPRALDDLDAIVQEFRMNIDSVTVVAYASPEGNYAYNEALSLRRADAMVRWLHGRYADVDFKQITKVAGGPDFKGLTERVKADSQLPYRDEVLSLVSDWGDQPVSVYNRLKAIRGGAPYAYIRRNYLPWMRTATTVIFHYRSEVSTYKASGAEGVESVFAQGGALPAVADPSLLPPVPTMATGQAQSWLIEDPIASTAVYEATDGLVNENESAADGIGQTTAPLVPVVTPAASGSRFAGKHPKFAVTTNLAYDAITAPNFGLIIPAGDHWAITAHYMFPWWVWDHNSRAFEILHWDLGARYYLHAQKPTDRATHTRTKLGGWYLSASAGIGYYDFEPKSKGWQGEEIMASVGGGYSLLLSPRWSLDFGMGFGPVFTKYRYYEGRYNDTRLIYQYKGKWSYFGPTSLNVGLTYMIYRKDRNK